MPPLDPLVNLPPLAHASGPRAWARAQRAFAAARRDRDRLIVHHARQGYAVTEIKTAFGLSEPRIYQIIENAKENT